MHFFLNRGGGGKGGNGVACRVMVPMVWFLWTKFHICPHSRFAELHRLFTRCFFHWCVLSSSVSSVCFHRVIITFQKNKTFSFLLVFLFFVLLNECFFELHSNRASDEPLPWNRHVKVWSPFSIAWLRFLVPMSPHHHLALSVLSPLFHFYLSI